MTSEESAFIFCTACQISFYLELISEIDNDPIPTTCPFCGTAGSLDDLELHMDMDDTKLQAAFRRSKFSLLKGGKSKEGSDAK